MKYKFPQLIAIIAILGVMMLYIPASASSILQPMTDSVNSGIINSKMYTDSALSNIEVDATVTNGIAVYRGTVHSKEQLDELIHIAHSVSGVKGVDTSRVVIK